MAKRTEIKQICDLCGRGPAQTWMVGQPDGQRCRVDLCVRCDDPIRKAFIAGRRTMTGPMGAEAVPFVEDYSPQEKSNVRQWHNAQEQRGN